MHNKLKRYCIYSDSNDTIVNYLRKRDIYFTAERVAELIYLIVYTTPYNIKRLKQYADCHLIGISISRTEPFMPEFMLPVMIPCMAMTIPGRKILRLQRSHLKYLASNPKKPIMDETDFFRKHYRKSKYSIVERLYERALRNK